MKKIADILKSFCRFFWKIEERIIDDFEGYDKETNMED